MKIFGVTLEYVNQNVMNIFVSITYHNIQVCIWVCGGGKLIDIL